MKIERLTQVTDEVVEAFNRLIPQLSSSNPAPTRAQLEEIVADSDCSVFVARDPQQQDKIVGSLTLVTFRIPTAVRSWIEDVVVDGAERGQGIGELLTYAALERAAELGAKTVDLTSRPSRAAANGLYQKVGFELRESNLYRYTLRK
jgi:ribosomal protein S18 acetylase RimI-like enzyme